MLRIIKESVTVDPTTGCWLWQGQTLQKRKARYSYVIVHGKRHYVHRLAAAAALGRDLDGIPVVHHACHVTHCVNPDHLQVVTIHENNVEMLEREAYKRRIKALEVALLALDPDHPLL